MAGMGTLAERKQRQKSRDIQETARTRDRQSKLDVQSLSNVGSMDVARERSRSSKEIQEMVGGSALSKQRLSNIGEMATTSATEAGRSKRSAAEIGLGKEKLGAEIKLGREELTSRTALGVGELEARKSRDFSKSKYEKGTLAQQVREADESRLQKFAGFSPEQRGAYMRFDPASQGEGIMQKGAFMAATDKKMMDINEAVKRGTLSPEEGEEARTNIYESIDPEMRKMMGLEDYGM